MAGLLVASFALLPASVEAKETSVTKTSDVGFRASVYEPGSGGSGNGTGSSADCSWTVLNAVGDAGRISSIVAGLGGLDEIEIDGTRAYRDIGGDRHLLYMRSGRDCTTGLVWVSTSLDPTDALPALEDTMERMLPLPVPDMSPMPDVGSYVNLGLWLAVDDPGVTVARATLGPVWAEGTGTLVGIEVDPGDGSAPIVCDGLGTPIADPDVMEQGPCGHTYVQSSPNDAPYQLSVTSVYEVTYRLSSGGTGSLGEIRRTETWDYDVDELQTVGTG